MPRIFIVRYCTCFAFKVSVQTLIPGNRQHHPGNGLPVTCGIHDVLKTIGFSLHVVYVHMFVHKQRTCQYVRACASSTVDPYLPRGNFEIFSIESPFKTDTSSGVAYQAHLSLRIN